MKDKFPLPLTQNDMLAIWNLTGHLLTHRLSVLRDENVDAPPDVGLGAFAAATAAYAQVVTTARGENGVDIAGTPFRFRIDEASGQARLEMHPQQKPANR